MKTQHKWGIPADLDEANAEIKKTKEKVLSLLNRHKNRMISAGEIMDSIGGSEDTTIIALNTLSMSEKIGKIGAMKKIWYGTKEATAKIVKVIEESE